MSDDDRSRWLDPSPPLPVDGEEPKPPRKRRRPTVLPRDEPPPPHGSDEPARDPEDATSA